MVGIDRAYDDHATMANLRHRLKKTKKNERRDTLQHYYRNDPKLYHTLQSILSGSIRTPDRLHDALIFKSDVSEFRACMVSRGTADHIFGDCTKYI